MGIRLEVDPARLKSLRTRLDIPLHGGAERAGFTEAELATWESETTALPVKTLQRLARAYNRNWYVFLLEDEVGKPAVPRDFRRRQGPAAELGEESLLAFDNAWLLLDKVESLNPSPESIVSEHPAQLSNSPETFAERFRERLDVVGPPETPDDYAVLRFWRDRLTSAGLYITQVPIPTDEVRAFCISRDGIHLIVLSNRDYPTARVFSLIHETGHLILGTDAMCLPSAAGVGSANSHEPWCNRFAAAVLMPRADLEANPKFHELIGGNIALGSARSLARDFGVSELALLRRLETFGHISRAEYQALQGELEKQWEQRPNAKGTGRMDHSKKVIARESPLFVRQVLDAHSRGDIPYREIGTLLDMPIRSIPKIREAVA